MPGFEYLFVTGTARSGTSVMADLLRSHPAIAMGRERYASKYISERNLPLSLFEKERFCLQLLDGDTHHKQLQPYYAELYLRFDRCRYVGDKIPEMACNYTPLLATYHRPKIIYMLRNIFDVADSFNQRAALARAENVHQGWPWDRESAAAVAEWNLSLRNTLSSIDEIELLIVPYEQLFVDDILLSRLFDFLQLSITEETTAAYTAGRKVRQKLEQTRRVALTSLEKLDIMRNADFDAYRRVLSMA
jgi:hypothetical protein